MANPSVPNFVELFKMSTLQLMSTMQLSDVEYGKVTSVNPLEITIDQKTKLTSNYLTLTNAVKDHTVDITVSWQTVDDDYLHDGAMQHTHQPGTYKDGEGSPLSGVSGTPVSFNTKHKHDIKGRKRITIHNGLTLGERVVLLRKAGGQDYIVLDRVDEAKTTGESV